MKIFDLKDNNLIIEPQVLTVPEFHALWKRDKNKNKDNAFKDLGYVYHLCDFNSPYAGYPAYIKEETIKIDLYKDKNYKIDSHIKLAVDKYKELHSTSKQRFVEAVKGKLDEITKFITETPVDEDTLKAILEIINNVGKTVATYDKIEDAVNKDTEKSNTKVRGDKKPGMFEN